MLEYTPQDVETIVKNELNQSLETLLREGARRMLQAALEMEVDQYVSQCQAQRDQNGHRQVVRNGHHPGAGAGQWRGQDTGPATTR